VDVGGTLAVAKAGVVAESLAIGMLLVGVLASKALVEGVLDMKSP